MDAPPVPLRRHCRLLVKFSGAAMVGFVVTAAVLHLALEAGLRPWAGQLIALAIAMNVTFVINGQLVFGGLKRRRLLPQWGAYLANSALGNVCSYWVFLTLESTHQPVIGNPYVALTVGSLVAWAINFMGARFIVFGRVGRRLRARWRLMCVSLASRPCDPAPAGPGSSRL